jgi:hypothetical protein
VPLSLLSLARELREIIALSLPRVQIDSSARPRGNLPHA